MKYCDGSGHQGYRKEPIIVNNQRLYIRGHNITIERLDHLEKTIKLFSEATHIVVGGISAGALATLHWTNYIIERVKIGKVWTLSDSGIFLNSLDKTTPAYALHNAFVNLLNLTNS